MAHDQETGRFAFSTPVYNGAILPTRAGQSQGGIEPVRLFDGEMHPLTSLGGRGTGSLGLSIVKDGVVRVDTEPASPTRQTTRDVRLVGKPADTSSSFGSSMEVTANASATVGKIELRHRLETDGIDTTYRLTRVAKRTQISLRVPVWAQNSKLDIVSGAVQKGGRWVRTSKPLTMRGTTPEGGSFTVRFGGIPDSARIGIVAVRPDSYRPRGARQLVITFATPKDGKAKITRAISVARVK
ncbi:MAG: hypothetical protein JHD16_07765 [Solirubrobacteraceae bacterium]|nr:hypothetical protein [Solirubrobacteraceae bacterium]